MDNKINSIGVIFGEYVRIYETYGANYLASIVTGEVKSNLIGQIKSYPYNGRSIITALNDMAGYDSMIVLTNQEYNELSKFVEESKMRCQVQHKLRENITPLDLVLFQYGYEGSQDTHELYTNNDVALDRLEYLLAYLQHTYDAVRHRYLNELIETRDTEIALDNLVNIFQVIVNTYKNIEHK